MDMFKIAVGGVKMALQYRDEYTRRQKALRLRNRLLYALGLAVSAFLGGFCVWCYFTWLR